MAPKSCVFLVVRKAGLYCSFSGTSPLMHFLPKLNWPWLLRVACIVTVRAFTRVRWVGFCAVLCCDWLFHVQLSPSAEQYNSRKQHSILMNANAFDRSSVVHECSVSCQCAQKLPRSSIPKPCSVEFEVKQLNSNTNTHKFTGVS